MSSYWYFKFRTTGFFPLISCLHSCHLPLSTLSVLIPKDKGIDRVKRAHNYSFTYPSSHTEQLQNINSNTTTINMFYDHGEQLKWFFACAFPTPYLITALRYLSMPPSHTRPTPLSLSSHVRPISGPEIDVQHQPLRGCQSSWVAVSSSFLRKGSWEIFSEFLACFITNCLCPLHLKVNVFLDVQILGTQFLSLSSLNMLLKSLMII